MIISDFIGDLWFKIAVCFSDAILQIWPTGSYSSSVSLFPVRYFIAVISYDNKCISNRQLDNLINSLFCLTLKISSKLHFTGPLWSSPVSGGSSEKCSERFRIMTSANLHITCPLWGEINRWIPLTRASNAESISLSSYLTSIYTMVLVAAMIVDVGIPV